MEIWVAGYPSQYGGADTELMAQIHLWRMKGVDVHLVPMFGQDQKARQVTDALGCTTHEYKPTIFKDKVVVSFCNGEFLKRLQEINDNGKPRATIWANCMTWLFDAEKVAHQKGYINHFIYQTQYQQNKLTQELATIAPVNAVPYKPYYSLENNAQNLKFSADRPTDYFGVGRVSRDDGSKYAPETWLIFGAVKAPQPVKAFILGYGPNAHRKCGNAPEGLDWATWAPGQIPVADFYPKIHALIHKTGGSRENYPRTILEAWHSGVVPIFEKQWGLPEIITDGVNGFLCDSALEMADRASALAKDEGLRQKMVQAGYQHLVDGVGNPDACWAPWETLLKNLGA